MHHRQTHHDFAHLPRFGVRARGRLENVIACLVCELSRAENSLPLEDSRCLSSVSATARLCVLCARQRRTGSRRGHGGRRDWDTLRWPHHALSGARQLRVLFVNFAGSVDTLSATESHSEKAHWRVLFVNFASSRLRANRILGRSVS